MLFFFYCRPHQSHCIIFREIPHLYTATASTYATNKLIKNLLKAARIYRIIYLSTRRNPLYRMCVKIVLFLTFPVVHIAFYNARGSTI